MLKHELEELVQEMGWAAVYMQNSVPLEFVEEYIEFLDLPYLFYSGSLKEVNNNLLEEIEQFTGENTVQFYLNLHEYTNKYLQQSVHLKNYGLPTLTSKKVENIKLQLDYMDYDITFSINNNRVVIYFELNKLPDTVYRHDTTFTHTKTIVLEEFNESRFLEIINSALIESQWNLYFNF